MHEGEGGEWCCDTQQLHSGRYTAGKRRTRVLSVRLLTHLSMSWVSSGLRPELSTSLRIRKGRKVVNSRLDGGAEGWLSETHDGMCFERVCVCVS